MESNWGRNVSDLGLGDLGATLAARLLDAPQYIFTNVTSLSTIPLVAVFQLPDMADDPYATAVASRLPGSHFPYGYDVEPFVPL